MKRLLLSLLTAVMMMPFAANAATYTVAGSAAILNGDANWAEKNADNDMTSTDGVNYTLEIKGISVEADKYYFKVVQDHSWDNCWPSSNFEFVISETAKYDITYTFNAETKDINATATKVGAFEGSTDKTYTVAGAPEKTGAGVDDSLFGKTWEPTLTANDMVKGDDGIYRLTKENVTLEAKIYEYKVVVNHAWGTSYPSSNAKLEITEAGNYNVTFTFNESTKEVGATATEIVDLTGRLVIGKVFYAGSTRIDGKTPKNYMKHLYIELFNNSTKTINVAGTYIAMANTDGSTNAWTAAAMAEAHPDSAVVKQIFQIPADNQVIMEPGKSLVIANCAVDHREFAAGNVNLSAADFEVKSANTGFGDHNDAVPALTIVKSFGTTDFINFLNPGPDGIVLLPASTDLASCPTTYPKGKTTGNLYTIVPLAGSIDAVDIVKQKTPSADDKRFAETYDAGFTCTKDPGTFNCQAVARKVAREEDGRKVLQDTNNSSEDFETLANVTPRTYGVDVVETYTATFTTNAGWEKVYAYAWYEAPEGEIGTAILLGTWPGLDITENKDDKGVYTVTFMSAIKPSFIIFNNGLDGEDKQQTGNLPFENGKAYEYAVEEPTTLSPYYLVGNMTNWVEEGVKEEYNLAKNEKAEGEEYMIILNLTADAQFKIVKKDGENYTWYPNDGDNYTITEAANYTVYFRPNADGGDDWFNKVIYVVNNTVGINTVATAAQKAVIYNMAGQRVMNAQKGLYIVNGKKVIR